MLADPEIQTSNHKMSKLTAPNLLDRVLPEMTFGEEDVVMDIGCATGDNTRNVILPRIPRLKRLIAIDVRREMIEYARVHMAHKMIEYHVADLQDKSTLKAWKGTISKVFSTHCFEWLKDQKRGFQSLYDLLKPKGEASLLFFLTTSMWDCYPSIMSDAKWEKYLKDVDPYVPESHHLNLGPEYYRDVLEDLGFEVLLCEEEKKTLAYKDEAEVKVVLKLYSALTYHFPHELKEEFVDELCEAFVKTNGRNSEGMPVVRVRNLTVHVRKP